MSSQLRSKSGFARKDNYHLPGFPGENLNRLVSYSSMQASEEHGVGPCQSRTSYSEAVQQLESHCLPQKLQALDDQVCTGSSGKGNKSRSQAAQEEYCTLESSSTSAGSAVYNTPSIYSVSSDGSPISQQESHSYSQDRQHSPCNTYESRSSSCVTDNTNDLWNKLRELETVMLGDLDIMDSSESTYHDGVNQSSLEFECWDQIMDILPARDLKQVLIECGKAVSDEDLLTANRLICELRQMVSVSGEPFERLSAYMLEGLVARLASTGSCIYKALKCKEPPSAELLSYMSLLDEVCPYFKFGYMSANGAIAEAMKDENRIHIIDFQISQGNQWITLIQALAARPGGPPYIRITGIDDSVSAYARSGGLQIVGQRLSRLANSCKVPFEFHAVTATRIEIEEQDLGIRPREALAVNFPYVLHHVPDESVSTANHRDRLLRLVRGLSPKVVTLIEQEFNTNTALFFPRYLETLNYFTAMFESIDVTLPRDHKERINVEQHCLARDVVNVISCEGAEREERQELLGKWKARFTMAGFIQYPLSSIVNTTIRTLMNNYSDNYKLEERDGALYLGWKDRNLVASCAWKC